MSEQIQSGGTDGGNPAVSELMIQRMSGIGPWIKFFAILGFIGIGFMALMMVLVSTTGMFKQPGMESFPTFIFIIMMLIFGVLYFFPSYFLLKSSNGVKLMKSGNVVGGMEEALKYMKSFWMFVGILTIVILSLYALLLIPTVFMGLMMGSR